MATAMDVDSEEIEMPTSSSSKGEKKRFEVKKVAIYNIFLIVMIQQILCFSGMQLPYGHGVSSTKFSFVWF